MIDPRDYPETHLAYARRVGAPRAVRCDIQLNPVARGHVWVCRSHDYFFTKRADALDSFPNMTGYNHPWRLIDRCPMSRLEEWRARMWELAA